MGKSPEGYGVLDDHALNAALQRTDEQLFHDPARVATEVADTCAGEGIQSENDFYSQRPKGAGFGNNPYWGIAQADICGTH
jgi:hypothetical protein